MSMNNGNRVLTGRSQQQQGFGNQQNPQQPNNALSNNPLANLSAMAQRLSGNMSGQNNGTASLYSSSSSRTNYSALLCIDDTMVEETMKAQALQEGGQFASQLVMICARRNVANPYYKGFRAALERFKSPRKQMPPEGVLVDFVNEIDSNQNLFNVILINSGIQLGAVFAQYLTTGDERIKSDRSLVEQLWYQCCVDTINLQFFDFLGNSPDGPQIFYRCSPILKEVLTDLEPRVYDLAMSRFTYASQQIPWRKGHIAGMQERNVVNNPLLDINTHFTDMGMQGTYFDPNYNPGQAGAQNVDTDGMRKLREYVARTAQQVNAGTYEAYVSNPAMAEENYPVQVTYDEFDKPELLIENITRENRLSYRISKYATNIPGTEWYVIPEHYVRYIMPTMSMDDGIPFRLRDTRCVGTQVVYRFNWEMGTFNFRLVKHNLPDFDVMTALISDPSKLLPFMYEENGIQKTTFDPTVYETNKFEHDGKIVPIGECKDLEKEPNVLIGNKPMKANQGNEETVKRLNIYTQTFDPKNKLDAFVLPMVMTREWKMEPDVNMDRFYSDFGMMVHNNKQDLSDTGRVIRSIRAAHQECDSAEFADFVKPYVTNLVNRWLIECRGYAETKQEAIESNESSYLKSSDIFADIDDFIEYLREKDLPTLRAFLDYKANYFIRYGIEVLASREDVKKEYKEKYGKDEDPIIRTAMLQAGEQSIIIRRNSVFFNIRKQNGPRTPDVAIIKQSGNPELFAIIAKALTTTRKHFEGDAQILIKFDKDEGNKVWVATRSDFDPTRVLVLRAISGDQDYVHPWPVCG